MYIIVRGDDYTAADPLQVTFSSGVAMLNDTACASISIVDDDALEGTPQLLLCTLLMLKWSLVSLLSSPLVHLHMPQCTYVIMKVY